MSEGNSEKSEGNSLGSQPITWQLAALRFGEELSSVGPVGYYTMTPSQWLTWAMSTLPVQSSESNWRGGSVAGEKHGD